MRTRVLATSSITLVFLIGVAWAAPTQKSPQQAGSAAKHPAITKQQVDTWMKELSNWGRWGKDDQLGTMNLVTDAKRKQAVALAKTGTVVSLAHMPPLVPKSQAQSAGAFLEIKLSLLSAAFTTEEQQLAFHGSSFTHIDALCHGDYDGKIYNGYPLKESVTEAGCKKLGIDALRGGVVTRGVLIDIPRLRGVSHLEPGTHVYQEDIEAWEKQAGVTIASGDAIFLHTGRWETGKTSGYDVSLIPWLKKRDVALVSSDGIQDVSEVEGTILPFHHYTLVALGANILDNAELTQLSETAARLKRWEFLFVTAPVATPGGTGSPVNPLAIF
jgi:kynurenine formamidase